MNKKILRKKMAGLKEWVKQDWVDIGAKKKGGGLKNVEENLQVDQKEKISKMRPCCQSSKDDRIPETECRCKKKS